MRTYPALEIVFPDESSDDRVDFLLAELDEVSPLAVEPLPGGVRVFFDDEAARDTAADIVSRRFADARFSAASISDEGWAERSQAGLGPVRVGRIVVTPPWARDEADRLAAETPDGVVIVVQPSMGFGTGHHESTRLCLKLLQRHLRPGVAVLDIGTGSGVLAVTAQRLGAGRVIAVDYDHDALHSAAETIELNGTPAIAVAHADITHGSAPLLEQHRIPGGFDLVLANITGAMLARYAGTIVSLVAHNGSVIGSGYQQDEVRIVSEAFGAHGFEKADDATESDWVASLFTRGAAGF